MLYSLSIYIKPLEYQNNKVSERTNYLAGRIVWQKYNCQSCHQLYGLGGYLGPDLTNEISRSGKGEAVIKALVRNGTKQMPAFNLSELEMDQLIGFLKVTDESGTADPRNFNRDQFGMIEPNEKK